MSCQLRTGCQLGLFHFGAHASHPRRRVQRREASWELTEMRELPQLSAVVLRRETSGAAARSEVSFIVGSLDELLSIRVDHLPDFDGFSGELLPLVERDELQIASGQQVPFGFISGLDRHIEKSRELLGCCLAASFGYRGL